MIRIEVAPDGPKGWYVDIDYGDLGHRELFRFKFFAVLHARALAKNEAVHGRTVSLKIKDKRGRYQEERTYPRSADPTRSKG